MDQLKKFTTNELIILGGALAVFIGVFLPWFKVDFFGASASANGFEYFFQGTLPWLLAIAVAVVLVLVKLDKLTLPDLPMPLNQIILIACGIIALLILTRIIFVDGDSDIVDRGIGLFLAFLGGIAMAVGAFLKFQAKEEEGGGGASSAPPTPF